MEKPGTGGIWRSAIIMYMNALRKWSTLLLVLVPLALGVVIPGGPEAFAFMDASQRAQAANLAGNRNNELSALKSMVPFQPWRAELWNRMGELQYDTGAYAEAIQSFQTASENGQLSAQGQFEIGKSWQALGETEKAKQVYRAVSESGLADAQLLLELALAQESLNDSIGTLATLLRAHGMAPLDNAINYALGIQFAATQPDNAIPFLENAAAETTYSTASSALITLIQNTASLGESAERSIYLGQELSTLAEWEAAASAFDKAVQIAPENGIAWALLGESVQHVGEDGFDDLSRALELNPHSDIVNGLMAVYFRRQKKYDLAITYLYKAAENNPNESTWQVEIANTLAMQGNVNDALIHFQVATLMDPENWIPWRELATFCVSYNFSVNPIGLDAARKALLLKPNSPSLLDLMGSAYMIMGDLDSAERFFTQALQVAPNQAEILYHMGQLYLEKKETAQALQYLRQAAQTTTDNRIRDNANRLIQMNGGG